MSGLESWEIDGIADALEDVMDDLADVYRQTGNRDQYGGGPEFVKVINDVKVSIHPQDFFQFQDNRMAGRITDITYYAMAFPSATPIRVGDVVDIFTNGVKVTVGQVERAETWDTMVKAYGQSIDEEGWFELNFHAGGMVT